jgi:asparagine synthase (glutamine-hydrolysing)
MCGIAGVLGSPDEALVRRMIEAIAHRGPNGIRTEAVRDAAFAHARLSIIDLEGGWQPLHAAGATVIGNGEIYNYLELVEQFQLRDLHTGSDFEPQLHLWERMGPKALAELRGMYAQCVLAGGARVLSRDPFGIKPLYVSEGGGRLNFASEPRALLTETRPVMVRERAEELLALNYTLGKGTIFEGVRRVAPGETLGVEVDAPAFVARTHAPTPITEAEALKRLDAVLEDSVKVHQRSDVPYGLFLSGGVDSATIATLMARLNSRPVTAYTCGFDDPAASDERKAAEKVARALDLDWRETQFGAEDFWRLAPEVAWALDDPTTDFATLPTYKLAEAAKGTLTVVLTGEGGDELFGGYGRYRRALRPRWLGGRPAEPQLNAPFLKDGGAAALERWRGEAREAVAPRKGLTPLQQAQAADMATWLPHDLLLKLDRCLMANGLEGRTPFLDLEVAEFAFHLPDALKVKGRFGKHLLRKWLEQHCPAADAWARKKGFTVPVAGWIAPRARELGPRIAAVEGVRQVCDLDAVRAVFERDEHAAARWPLLFFALWSTIHIGGATRAEAAQAVIGG